MKKRLLIQLLIQVILTIILGFGLGLVAIFFGAIVGTTSASIAEEFTFGMVEGIVCPEETMIEVKTGRQWESSHEVFVSCVGEDGTRYEGMLGKSLLAIIGLYSLVCFVPLFIPTSIILCIVIHKMSANSKQILQ